MVQLKNDVKVFILADTLEEYNSTIQRALVYDSEFLDHEPTWWRGTDLTKVDEYTHVQFINGRATDNAINSSEYEVDFW